MKDIWTAAVKNESADGFPRRYGLVSLNKYFHSIFHRYLCIIRFAIMLKVYKHENKSHSIG